MEFICADKLRINPQDLCELEFYRIEYLLKNLEEKIDEEEKQYKKQQKDQDKQYQQQQTKMPSSKDYGGFKTPKIDIPKVNIPKIKI